MQRLERNTKLLESTAESLTRRELLTRGTVYLTRALGQDECLDEKQVLNQDGTVDEQDTTINQTEPIDPHARETDCGIDSMSEDESAGEQRTTHKSQERQHQQARFMPSRSFLKTAEVGPTCEMEKNYFRPCSLNDGDARQAQMPYMNPNFFITGIHISTQSWH